MANSENGVAVAFNCSKKWVLDHKLGSVGTLWGSSLLGSMAYNWSSPNMATSVKLIHARLHAQALTLGALAAVASYNYYQRSKSNESQL